MKRRILILGVLLLSGLNYGANYTQRTANKITQEVEKDQKTKYEERKKWIKDKKNELLSLCNQLINMYDFPKTNIEKERDKLKLRVRMYEKEIKDIDYANDKKFEGIQNKFAAIEDYFRSYTLKLKERENMRR